MKSEGVVSSTQEDKQNRSTSLPPITRMNNATFILPNEKNEKKQMDSSRSNSQAEKQMLDYDYWESKHDERLESIKQIIEASATTKASQARN